jgi:hypothetical protein
MTGMDVHKFVIEQRPELESTFIFITGGAFTEGAQTFLSEVDLPVLHKPFSLDDIAGCLPRPAPRP